MYEVWEVDENDGCIQPIRLIDQKITLFDATSLAVQCARPGIEVKHKGIWISHLCDAQGRWLRAIR